MVTNKQSYKTVLLHRYVWENSNNARLLQWAHVHHIDGNVNNNSPLNLEAMMDYQHRKTYNFKGMKGTKHKFHRKKNMSNRVCGKCGSSTTHTDKLGRHHWRKSSDAIWLCHKCYMKYVWNPKQK